MKSFLKITINFTIAFFLFFFNLFKIFLNIKKIFFADVIIFQNERAGFGNIFTS